MNSKLIASMLAVSGAMAAPAIAQVCPPPSNGGAQPGKSVDSGSGGSTASPSSPSTPSSPGPAAPAPSAPRTPSGPAHGGATPWTPPNVGSGPGSPPLLPLDPLSPVADARIDIASWHTWWRFNGESYLGLEERLDEVDRRTGDGSMTLGSGEQAEDGVPLRTITDHVLPSLWAIVQEGGDHASTRAALLALGRIEGTSSLPPGQSVLSGAPRLLASGDQEAVEATILALGLTGRGEAISMLIDLAADSENGRKLVEADKVDYRRRTMAIYGLALAARTGELSEHDAKRIAVALTEPLGNELAPYDLQLACVVAVGLTPMPRHTEVPKADDGGAHWCLEGQVAQLIEFARDPMRHGWLRAQARIPLAKLAADCSAEMRSRAVALLVEPLEANHKSPPELQQASAIALGLIGDCDQDALDVEIRSCLLRVAQKGDRLSRGLALISLGKVAARTGNGGAARTELVEYLQTQLVRGTEDRRAWAALAIGVLGHDAARLRGEVPADLATALRGAVSAAKTPDDAAAACLALAVLRDPRGSEPVLGLFGKSKDETIRSYAALSLGWMGAREAADPLAKLFVGGPRQGGLFTHAATALRLLGSASVVPGLIEHGQAEAGRKGEDESGLVACAGMLGKLGDPRAVGFLAKLARESSAKSRARAAAAVALADLCDEEPRHWSCAVSTDLHFGLMSSTLLSFSGNGTGLLEMR